MRIGRKSPAYVAVLALGSALAVIPAPAMGTSSPATFTARPAAVGDVTEYPIPTANSNPVGITAGPDGNLWFTENSQGKVAKMTTAGITTEYPLPSADRGPTGIIAGPDGNLWFTEALNFVAKMTTSGVITEYSIPTSLSDPRGIARGPDGNLWFTEYQTDKVAKVTTAGVITEYALPPSGLIGPFGSNGIAAGPDGNLWITEQIGNKVAKVTPAGVFTEYDVPTHNSGPIGITAGPDGNLWFVEQYEGKVAKVTTSGVFTEYPLPRLYPSTSTNPTFIAPGPDGNLWVTEYWFASGGGNHVARVTTSGAITEYALPIPDRLPYGITAGPDGNIWFTETGTNNIGKIDVLPPVVAVLPAMANAAYGGYTTVAQIQNIGSSPAAVYIVYLDAGGNTVGTGDALQSLAVNGTWSVRQDNGHAFAGGQAGWARVYSSQPVASFVNEFAPGAGDATSYTGINPTGTGSILYAPAIANNAYGGYTTGIGLTNLAGSATDLTISYRNASGATVTTQAINNIAAGAYQAIYSGDPTLGLPAGFAGTATIQSSAGSVAAVVNETGPGGQFSSYDAVPAGSTTVFAPAALNNAYGGYFTGMGIQNTTGSAGTVTVTYFDGAGNPTAKTFSLAAGGYLPVYQGSATDGPGQGAFTARITSTVAVAAIVNEVAPSNTSAKQSTAYNTFASGAAALNLPLVEAAGSDGWSTGEGIMNTGSVATTVTVTYFDAASGAPIGAPQSLTLQPNAFWGLYQPAGGLPSGTRASAQVTTTGQPVAVICNESNATTFMSYSGQ